MARFHFRAVTDRRPGDVVAFFADMTNASSWDPSISKVIRLDEGVVEEGSSFRVSLGFVGRTLDLDYRIVAFEPTSLVVLRAESNLFLSEDTVRVGEANGRTSVDYEARLSGQGALRILDPLFGLTIRHFGKNAGAQLRSGYLA